jgi:spore coat polysaccharide biosynthesis protein SpsF (cytidylyltransferase family)
LNIATPTSGSSHTIGLEFLLVTNVFPRSFPKGQSVDVISRSALERLAREAKLAEDREHVTRYAYRHSGDLVIRI